MSKPFRLILSKIECVSEQLSEPGKDEIYILGIGVTSAGQRFLVAPQKLGNFSTGSATASSYSRTLVDVHVQDHVRAAHTCFWLFERDSGGLANGEATIQKDFERLMDRHLSWIAPLGYGEAQYPYALARTAMDLRIHLMALARAWNSDELSEPVMLDHTVVDPALPPAQKYRRTFTGAGVYVLEFQHSLHLVAPVVLL